MNQNHKAMKRLIIITLVLMSITVTAQTKRIQFGFGVDYVFGEHFPETNEYVQVYEGGRNDEYTITTRPIIDFFRVMKMYTPNREMAIPLFLKIKLGDFNIKPMISFSPISIGRNDVAIKSNDERVPYSLTTTRGDAGDRGWNHGKDIHLSGEHWLADAKLNTTRIGTYITYDKNAWEFGLGLFKDFRKYEIFHWRYSANYDYRYYTSDEYHYSLDDYDVYDCYYGITRNDLRESAEKIVNIKTSSIEVPIYVSVGWDNVRLKAECIFTEFDMYGSLGLEFIFNSL